MLIINGTDYGVYLVAIGSFLVLFGWEYLVCRKTDSRVMRWLPWGYVALQLVLSVGCFLGDTGGFIDLRSFFALLFLGYAGLCAAGIVTGWLLGRRKPS